MQAQQKAEQTQQAADQQKAKALEKAQAEAAAIVASGEKAAAATLREAETKAAQLVQQQEAQAEKTVEAAKQKVSLSLQHCPCCTACVSSQGLPPWGSPICAVCAGHAILIALQHAVYFSARCWTNGSA